MQVYILTLEKNHATIVIYIRHIAEAEVLCRIQGNLGTVLT